MSQICQKCGQEYEPQRRGGKFCSTSCRVVWYQRAKRQVPLPRIPTGDEVYLANKLEAVGRSSLDTLSKVQGLPPEQAMAELRRFVEGWSGAANNSIIARILADDERFRKADYAAYRKHTGLF